MVLGKFPFFPPHPVPIATFLSRELFFLSHLFQNSFSKFDDFEDFERVEKLIFAPRIDHVNRVTILIDINRKSIGESSNGGGGGSKTFQVGVAVSPLIRILDERNRKQTKAGSAVEGPPPFLLLDASSTPFQVATSLSSGSSEEERAPVEALEERASYQSLSPPSEEPLPPLAPIRSALDPPRPPLDPSFPLAPSATRLSTPPSHPSRAIMKDINYNFISNYR